MCALRVGLEVGLATYVLVHGSGSGGWLWEPVTALLREQGHVVRAPTLVGVGERTSEGGPHTNLTSHVEQIVAVVEGDTARRVVLVGFSYGGLVVEGVAATVPDRIRQLVLVDGMTVAKGECAMDAFTPSAAQRIRAAAAEVGDGWKVPPNPVELVGGFGAAEDGVRAADIAQTFAARRGTHPIGTYEEPVTWDESSVVSRCYVMCTDKPPGAAREWSLARMRALRDARYIVHELPTGHFPMQTMPMALTSILLHSAQIEPTR